MKIPLSWLREYIEMKLPVGELAERLTMSGSEVKGIERVGEGWQDIVVARIVDVQPHPNADRLRLVTVDTGSSQTTVVCGAPNLNVGDKVAFAPAGAELIDSKSGRKTPLESAKIRGVESGGMVCSEKELGISENHEGIMVLPSEADAGSPLADYLGDAILDLDITPNRPDCLSVLGIVREAAALTGQRFKLADAEYEEKGTDIKRQIEVEITDAELCPRYSCTLLKGIKIAQSPPWLQQRLIASGMRPINNIVDIANYVMLEHGQPLHAFDYDKLKGKKIVVRRANLGETIVSLEGAERKLTMDTLVIADGERPVAIAGVMGGANSEVGPETVNILLESASFNPANIHHTSRSLNLVSEASMRFERGIAPGLTLPAVKRATQLILEIAGGEAAKDIIDAYPGQKPRRNIPLGESKLKGLLGLDIKMDRATKVLTHLGFDWISLTEDVDEMDYIDETGEVEVYPPYWRTDVSLDVDLIEEVARIIGYDELPTTMLDHSLPPQDVAPIIGLKRNVRQHLVGADFQEIISYSLTSLEMLRRLWPVSGSPKPMPLRMANPMTVDQEYLRTTLRASLLEAVAANRRHDEGSIRLFELGRVFLPRPEDLPIEPEVLCAVLHGPRQEKGWSGEAEPFDFFDAKGLAESLLGKLGITATYAPGSNEDFRAGSQAVILVDGRKLGLVGQVHPVVSQSFDISGPVYLLQLNLTGLLPHTLGTPGYQAVPRYPAVVRDAALVVDNAISHHQLVAVMSSFPMVSGVSLFDVYSGKQLPTNKKSLAYRLTFRSADHTLTDEEADLVFKQILKKLADEFEATLRG
jgi:phenylalanyl-tRNA synthetase beta chain